MALRRMFPFVFVVAVACDVSAPAMPEMGQQDQGDVGPADVDVAKEDTITPADTVTEFAVPDMAVPDVSVEDPSPGDTSPSEVMIEVVPIDVTIEVTPTCSDNMSCGANEFCKLKDCIAPGTCTEKPAACPKLYAPACGCDNQTYDNACFAEAAGVSVAHEGACTGSKCNSNGECANTDYCFFSNCEGPGTCKTRQTLCSDVWAPVCGCDGNTYSSECDAAAAGMNVAYTGECKTACKVSTQCKAEEYCQLTNCEPPGTCEATPKFCVLVKDPVCGCDKKTYTNACAAAQAGMSVAYKGECVAGGCISNAECTSTQYCEMNACTPPGKCVAKPTTCPLIYNPVCGCDGKTYSNSCSAASAGVNVKATGACSVPM